MYQMRVKVVKACAAVWSLLLSGCLLLLLSNSAARPVQHQASANAWVQDLVMLRLATREAAAGLIAEAEAAAEVKDADEGKEFGRGKRLRYASTYAC